MSPEAQCAATFFQTASSAVFHVSAILVLAPRAERLQGRCFGREDDKTLTESIPLHWHGNRGDVARQTGRHTNGLGSSLQFPFFLKHCHVVAYRMKADDLSTMAMLTYRCL
ncbi:hypothetical protein EYF80_031003 [Liparis tanakae]|uniref:Uncharacterized protein n=1 Tax=Liparis tanakae TaxID=230148 RepID=A0A4Z2GYS2_9TELE|nr:hypothetical protein EYF80_031003 [Liparis tanakae]